MTLEYFKMPKDYADFKAQYRRLAMQYHPDVGGSVEIMQIINTYTFTCAYAVEKDGKTLLVWHAPYHTEVFEIPVDGKKVI